MASQASATWRIGQTKTWMRAHIWLGLLTVPLLLLHSGFEFRNTLANVLTILLLIVVVSGIWGLVLQQLLPQRMLHDIPAETIHSQIDSVMKQLTREGKRLVNATCGYGADEEEAEEEGELAGVGFMTLGAVRGRQGTGQGLADESASAAHPRCGTVARLL